MIEKINHYSMANPASIYDEEALTALELAGRTAGKVNECVTQFNALEKETNEHLAKQDREIPVKVENAVNNHIHNGDFDHAIDEYAGELTDRVNNIVASAGNGNTEIVDMRLGADGKTYATAGDATRKQFEAMRKRSAYAFAFVNRPPVATYTESSVEVKINGTLNILFNAQSYALSNQTVTFTHSGRTIFVLLFNITNNALVIKNYNEAVDEDEIMFGYCYKDEVFVFGGGYNLDVPQVDSFNPLTPDVWTDEEPVFTEETTSTGKRITAHIGSTYVFTGKKSVNITARDIVKDVASVNVYRIIYNIATDDLSIIANNTQIPNGYIAIGVYHSWYGVFLNGCTHYSTEKALTLAPLILGAKKQYIEFDSVKGVITFPDDTLIQVNQHGGFAKHYTLSESVGNNVATFDVTGGTALIVVFNTKTNALEVVRFNTKLNSSYIAIATFRMTGQVSILAPYKWNGKPYNLDITSNNGTSTANRFETVKSINHRGYSSEAPENTIKAFKKSAEKGFKYVECDVRFTSDGVPVLLHDETIDRTSNGSGAIASMTFEQARAFDFGQGEKIPSFVEFIALCKSLGLHAYVEIKSTDKTALSKVIYAVHANGMREYVTFLSFDVNALKAVKELDGKVRLGLVMNGLDSVRKMELNQLVDGESEVFADIALANVNDDIVTYLIDNNIPLEVWTVNSVYDVSRMNPYITGVTSDIVHAGNELSDGDYNGTMTPQKGGGTATFTLYASGDKKEYTFESGMTWSQFVASSYNTDNKFFIDSVDNSLRYKMNDAGSNYWVVDMSYNTAKPDDTVLAQEYQTD